MMYRDPPGIYTTLQWTINEDSFCFTFTKFDHLVEADLSKKSSKRHSFISNSRLCVSLWLDTLAFLCDSTPFVISKFWFHRKLYFFGGFSCLVRTSKQGVYSPNMRHWHPNSTIVYNLGVTSNHFCALENGYPHTTQIFLKARGDPQNPFRLYEGAS